MKSQLSFASYVAMPEYRRGKYLNEFGRGNDKNLNLLQSPNQYFLRMMLYQQSF